MKDEDELVLLEEAARGVGEDGEGDAVDQVAHALLHVLAHLRAVDGFLKHYAERLGEHTKYILYTMRIITPAEITVM